MLAERGLQFSYPRRRPSAGQLSELRADQQRARRRNRRLQLALCARWTDYVNTKMVAYSWWLLEREWSVLIGISQGVQEELQLQEDADRWTGG